MAMQVLEQGPRNLVIKFSGAGANTVDVSALSPPCEDLRIVKVTYDNNGDPSGDPITIEGDATADVTLLQLHGHSETLDFCSFGGLVNNAGAGKTGDIIVTLPTASTATVVITFRKVRTNSPL